MPRTLHAERLLLAAALIAAAWGAIRCGDGGTGPDGDGDADIDVDSDADVDSDTDTDTDTDSDQDQPPGPDGDADADEPVIDAGDVDSPHDSGSDAGDSEDARPDTDPPVVPLDDIDDLRLYINIGDSLAAGYNADGRNDRGGHGYARLLLDNHPDYPAYAGHHLTALFPGVEAHDVSESGATTSDALDNIDHALRRSLPREVDGDVLVTLTCGGNDFNDDWRVMTVPAATRVVAAQIQANYREIFRRIRERYEDHDLGRDVVFLVTNVHDPTGGTGSVPREFNDDFCETIHRFPAALRGLAVSNLGIINEAIASVVSELGGHLVDNHGLFLDHGMNAGGARCIDDDCVHPTTEGHHQLRRLEWTVLTGEER
jgi:lysophospholipase L1-like esterase